MALFGLQAREVALASMTDTDLILQLWSQIGDVRGLRRRDDLYATASELLERLAPEAEWASEEAYQRRSASPGSIEHELEAGRESRERRRQAREALAALGSEGAVR